MDQQSVWTHIHAERAALATTLAALSDEQWARASLCQGWSVKDVAAHVIAHPQTGWAQMPGMLVRNVGRGYNAMIFREVKRLGERSTKQSVLADFAAHATSTRKVASEAGVPLSQVIEPLIDSLVHHQDIVRPLGLAHAMDPVAAAVAAERCRLLSGLMGSRRVVKSVRMVASDVDWDRGRGPILTGPMQELLMVCAGRSRVATDLSGDGLELISQA